jgi:hypothetical protein
MQHYVIKFVSDLWQVGGFRLALSLLPEPVSLRVVTNSCDRRDQSLPRVVCPYIECRTDNSGYRLRRDLMSERFKDTNSLFAENG